MTSFLSVSYQRSTTVYITDNNLLCPLNWWSYYRYVACTNMYWQFVGWWMSQQLEWLQSCVGQMIYIMSITIDISLCNNQIYVHVAMTFGWHSDDIGQKRERKVSRHDVCHSTAWADSSNGDGAQHRQLCTCNQNLIIRWMRLLCVNKWFLSIIGNAQLNRIRSKQGSDWKGTDKTQAYIKWKLVSRLVWFVRDSQLNSVLLLFKGTPT